MMHWNRPSMAAPAVVLLAVLAVACAGRSSDLDSAANRDEPIRVSITNQNFLDVHAYVIYGGQRHSLGLVTGKGELEVLLPRTRRSPDGQYRFLAEPVGTDANYLSDQLYIEPGEQVVWRINQRLVQSSVSVW